MKKKFAMMALAAALTTVTITSCSKYEDGPAFSLISKKSRLAGEWKIESVSENDQDITEMQKALVGDNFVWTIEKDGSYSQTGNFPDKGTWEFGGDKDEVKFKSEDASIRPEITYHILRLASKELWLKHTDTNGDVTKIKLKQ